MLVNFLAPFALFVSANTEAPVIGPQSAVVELAKLTNNVCFKVASNELSFGTNIDDDQKAITVAGFQYGIQQQIYERFGRQYEAILNRSTMAHKVSGDDAVVLADGGAAPGCKSMLLSKSDGQFFNDFAKIITNEKFAWKEAPSTDPQRAGVTKKMFLKRGSDDRAYLINLMSLRFEGSDLRLLTTVNPVPANVTLPKGF
jgi:hypothetical protein